jgi:glycosyltransferase involved in cell wall biosynthesis
LNPANDTKPQISIIMPVYNAEKFIGQALENIAAQTFKDYELLLLNGASTDATTAIITERKRTDHWIRLITEKDRGIYDAMNKGIALAKGEWIYFMGCDDAFYNEHVLTNVSRQLLDDLDIVYGDVLWMPDEIKERGDCKPEHLLHHNINHQRIFYRNSVFQQWGTYNLQYKVAADHELNIRLFCNNRIRKKYMPLTIAKYNAVGFSAGKLDEDFWTNWKEIFSRNFSAHLPQKELYSKLGWYCRYQLGKRNYRKSFVLFCDVFLHTLSLGFVLLTIRHFINLQKEHAS